MADHKTLRFSKANVVVIAGNQFQHCDPAGDPGIIIPKVSGTVTMCRGKGSRALAAHVRWRRRTIPAKTVESRKVDLQSPAFTRQKSPLFKGLKALFELPPRPAA